MESFDVTLGGLSLSLALHFGAAKDLSQKVGDILMITNEAMLETMLAKHKMVHSPKWVPTVENIPLIFWIGAKNCGSTVKISDVENAVFLHGFIEAKELALQYLACLATPTAREKLSDVPEAAGNPEK